MTNSVLTFSHAEAVSFLLSLFVLGGRKIFSLKNHQWKMCRNVNFCAKTKAKRAAQEYLLHKSSDLFRNAGDQTISALFGDAALVSAVSTNGARKASFRHTILLASAGLQTLVRHGTISVPVDTLAARQAKKPSGTAS
jgi:hypothetical protein